MNIHISALIQKMEEELKKAKTAEGDEELKRHVAVVRSLCDVVLDQPETGSTTRIQPSVTASPSAPPSTDQLLMEKMMGSAGLNKYRKQEKDKQEEDGNGESLFDF
ncbi:YwdI family protein [Bacillus halotolerans]|uniref:YwdI family protein n=1 Tax=Bacillus halotolerans TaxID=260554 RepID=UPI003EB82416